MDRRQYSRPPRTMNLPRVPLFLPYRHQCYKGRASKRLDDEIFDTPSRGLLGLLSFFESGEILFADGRSGLDEISTQRCFAVATLL
jgi:hypothetical protein